MSFQIHSSSFTQASAALIALPSQTQTLTNKSLDASSTAIVDENDETKQIVFVVENSEPDSALTLESLITQNRTITFPDQSGTVALTRNVPSFADGQNGFPSISFTNQLNTGIYRADGDTSKMVLTADGYDVLELHGYGVEGAAPYANFLFPVAFPNQAQVLKKGGTTQTITSGTFQRVSGFNNTQNIIGFTENAGLFTLSEVDPAYGGYYLCTADIKFATDAIGNRGAVFEVIGDGTIPYGLTKVRALQLEETVFSISTVVRLYAGTNLDFKVFQDCGNDLDFMTGDCSMSIIKMI